MKKENLFSYEKYISEPSSKIKQDEDGKGYSIVVGFCKADLDNPFDKAGRSILNNIEFHININAKSPKNKWEIVSYGKYKALVNLNEFERTKLEILKRQMPHFFKKYKEATAQQFTIFARNLLRPMRNCQCRYKLNEVRKETFLMFNLKNNTKI